MLVVIGLTVVFAAEGKWRKGRKTDAWITGGIGGALCLAAAGLVPPMRRTVARAKERRRQEDAHPREPWKWEPTWLEQTGIPQSRRRHAGVMLFAGTVAVLVSLPPVLALPRELARGNFGILVALLFPVIGFSFLSLAALDALRRRKYGLARFVSAAVPVPFGGEVAGMVIVDRAIVPLRPGTVSVDCHRTTLTRSGNKRHQRSDVVAHVEREIAPADWITAVGESRLFVQLPISGGVPTSMTPLEVGYPTYEWRLRVSVPTSGPDFVAEFVLPVFDVANLTGTASAG